MYKILLLFVISFTVNAGGATSSNSGYGDSNPIVSCDMPVDSVEIYNNSQKMIEFVLWNGLKIPLSPGKSEIFKKKCESEDVADYLEKHQCEMVKFEKNKYSIKDCKK
jgi:hypothetical protein